MSGTFVRKASLLSWGIVVALGSTSLTAATIEKVLVEEDAVILKLTDGERDAVKAGDDVNMRVGGKKIAGEVKDISGSKAKVYVVFGIDDLAEGQTAKVSAVNASRDNAGGGKRTGLQQTTFRDDFNMPFVFISGLDPELNSSRALSSYFGAQSVRFGNMGGVFFASLGDTKSSEKNDSAKIVVDGENQAFGGGPVYSAKGVRLGIAAAKRTTAWKMTTKPTDGGTNKAKAEFDDMIIALSAATIFDNGVFAGLQLLSHDYEVTWDMRDIGGTREDGSESISELQLSLGFADADQEVAVNYAPPIDIEEDLVMVARPLTWTVNYRRKMGQMDALAGFYHAYHSALSSTQKNRQGLSVGGLWTTGFGSVSALFNYATKYYRGKEDATPLNIAHYGGTLGGRYGIDRQSDVGFLLDYQLGEDNGKDADGSTDLEHTGLMAQVSYSRYY